MKKLKIFISSVQNEFAREREALYLHFCTDALLSSFFEPVLFEKLPAAIQAPNKVYIGEVEQSQIYLILVGQQYGFEDENGVSPTEHEYNHAHMLNLDSLAFIKGNSSVPRHEKESMLLRKIQNQLSYKRFESVDELISEVTKACITLLKHKGLIRFTTFDESINDRATLADIDSDKIDTFIAIARANRGFPLHVGTPVRKVLAQMNMIFGERLSNSALLAFSKDPQRFFPTAIVKCAHFHGLHAQKPIPDQKVMNGDVFEQVDQAIDFVLSKLILSVGTRNESVQAPIRYEIPQAVVNEAIVNAVAHRDYYSNGSVQVMLFADRLEISNPGRLTPELSIEKLKTDHASYPTNPLLAESMYQAGYIERYGTGIGEIFHLTTEAGLKEPEIKLDEGFKVIIWRPAAVTGQVTGQATGQVTGQVEESIRRVLLVIFDEMKSSEIQSALQLKHREYFRDNYLNPTLDQGFVDMVFQEKPNSPNQKYRLTPNGIAFRNRLLNPQSIPKPAEEEINKTISGEATIHEPIHVTDHVTDHVEELVVRILQALDGEMSRLDIMEKLGLKHRPNFMGNYIQPALDSNYIEMTLPDKPTSINQKYRLTAKGIAIKQQLENKK